MDQYNVHSYRYILLVLISIVLLVLVLYEASETTGGMGSSRSFLWVPLQFMVTNLVAFIQWIVYVLRALVEICPVRTTPGYFLPNYIPKDTQGILYDVAEHMRLRHPSPPDVPSQCLYHIDKDIYHQLKLVAYAGDEENATKMEIWTWMIVAAVSHILYNFILSHYNYAWRNCTTTVTAAVVIKSKSLLSSSGGLDNTNHDNATRAGGVEKMSSSSVSKSHSPRWFQNLDFFTRTADNLSALELSQKQQVLPPVTTTTDFQRSTQRSTKYRQMQPLKDSKGILLQQQQKEWTTVARIDDDMNKKPILLTRDLLGQLVIRCLVEYSLLVFPFITLPFFPETLYPFVILLIIFLFYAIKSHISAKNEDLRIFCNPFRRLALHHKTPTEVWFITGIRGYNSMAIFIGILLVDFFVFPRKYAKTITHGYSMMDYGVSYVAFGMGFLSRRSRGLKSPDSIFSDILGKLWIPLIAGLLRVALHMLNIIQTPVVEYGTTWNFFFTMVYIQIVGTFALKYFIPVKYAWLWSLCLAILHQTTLSWWGLENYILTAPRTNYFSSNREGIFSTTGFLCLYLFGSSLGSFVTWTRPPKSTSFHDLPFTRALIICVMSVFIAIAAILITHVTGERESRRTVNFLWLLWSIQFNCTGVALALVVDLCVRNKNLTYIFIGTTSNLLYVFLMVNVATGFINLTIQTLIQPLWVAVLVMIIYTAFWSAVAFVLGVTGARLKVRWNPDWTDLILFRRKGSTGSSSYRGAKSG